MKPTAQIIARLIIEAQAKQSSARAYELHAIECKRDAKLCGEVIAKLKRRRGRWRDVGTFIHLTNGCQYVIRRVHFGKPRYGKPLLATWTAFGWKPVFGDIENGKSIEIFGGAL